MRAIALVACVLMLSGCAAPAASDDRAQQETVQLTAAPETLAVLVEDAPRADDAATAVALPREPTVVVLRTNYTIGVEVAAPGGGGAGNGGDGGLLKLPRAGAAHLTLVAVWDSLDSELSVWLDDAEGGELARARGSSPLVLDAPDLGEGTLFRAAAWPAGAGAYYEEPVEFIATVVYP